MTLIHENLQAVEEQIRVIILQEADIATALPLLDGVHPADLADILERLPTQEGATLFLSLDLERGAEVLHKLGRETTRQFFKDLDAHTIAQYLNIMPMDEVADILTHDVPERIEDLLDAMRSTDAREVRRLIGYPPDSIGRLMTEKFVHITPDKPINEVLDYLRQVDPEVETVTDLYVVDDNDQLIGVVSLRGLITAPNQARTIRDIMTTDLVTVLPHTDREDVARLVARYDFLAIPVVSPEGRILGIVTVDDIIHILTQENTEDVLRFGGLEGSAFIDQSYFTMSIRKVIRSRIGWLLLLFLADTLTGSVLRAFDQELQTVVALSFFIPLLIGTGGNTGSQTVSTIIRGMALREIMLRDTLKVIRREFGVGILLGVLLGVVGFVRTLTWGLDSTFGLVIALTLIVICTWSNTVGALIPLLARRVGIDPAIVSAPLITTVVDATGLLLYLLIAKAILGI